MKKIYTAFLAMFALAYTNTSAQSCMYSNASTTADLAVMKTAGFTDMIVALWSVQPNGDITWGPNTICSGGNFTMGNTLPNYAADMNGLKQGTTCIKRLEAGLGGWGNGTYTNIRDLINAQGTGTGSILYRNFKALKNAIPALDALNDDDEATYDANATIKFAVMLADIGFKYTLAPYMQAGHWQGVANNINAQRPGTLDRIYLQCYDGGAGNNPCNWNFGVPLYAGLWDYDSNADIQSKLTNWKNSCGIVGGFMWFERTANTDRINYGNLIGPIFGYSCRPPASTGLVTIYEDLNFTGYSNGFSTGDYNLTALKGMGMADNTLTSIKVSEGYKAILYFDDNFTGNSVTITADQGWIGGTFNDQVTSLRVLPNGNPNLAGTYFLKNNISGWFVDLANADPANGTQIRQWDFNGSDAQKFRFEHLGDGNYRVICVTSNKVWDVNGISQTEGAVIHEWDNANGKNQHFILVDAGNGLVKMIAEHSGKVAEVSTSNSGEQLHQWWNANQANSFWRLMPANQTGVVSVYTDCNNAGFRVALQTGTYTLAQLNTLGFTDNSLSSMQVPEGFKVILYTDDNFTGNSITITGDVSCYAAAWDNQVTSLKVLPNGNPNLAGTYYVKNSVSGLVMDVWGASTANDATVSQGVFYTGAHNQQFTFNHLGDGNYAIIGINSNKLIGVNQALLADGTGITQYDNVNVKNQHFIAVDAGNGVFKLIAEHSAKVIDVSTNNNGEQLHQAGNTGQNTSKWMFVPTDQIIGTGTGLRANYFNGQNFETPVYTSLDATIDADWGNGSPNVAVNNDSFTARWTGQIQAKTSTEYTFYINSDNGRRLWVNNQLIIDKWLDDVNENSGKITLTAGQKYDITVEYFENNGGANAHLSWSTVASGKEIIPVTQLHPNALPTASITSPTNNQSFTIPAAINITTNTADTDGNVARVEFYNGTAKLGEKTTSPFTYSWTGATKGSYTITVRAYDNKGAVTVSTPVNVTVNVATGIDDSQVTSGLSIYPNPAENILYVNGLKDENTAKINIFDLQGKLLLSPNSKQNEIAIDAIPQGFYIIQITETEQKLVQKFVKK